MASPSIPPSPPPDKDPPPTSSANPSTTPPSNNPPPPPPPEPSADTESQTTTTTKSALRPTPPKPPTILTTHPSFTTSTSTTLHTTLSHTQTQPQPPAPNPNFTPFFTLITDLHAKDSTLHPHNIHYIFSDDDTSEILTTSLINSLPLPSSASQSQLQSAPLSGASSNNLSDQSHIKTNASSNSSSAMLRKKSGRKEEERVVIVDINESGTGVERVRSLASSWQVLSASISSAPTFESSSSSSPAETGGRQERGLMLRIEGVGVDSLVAGMGDEMTGKREGGVAGDEEMAGLVEGFDGRMGVLRRVVRAQCEKGDLSVGEEGENRGTVVEAVGGEEKEVGEG